MDNFEVKSLIEGMTPRRAHVLDRYGRTYLIEDYIEYCHKVITAKQEAEIIPRLYEGPIGVQLELTYRLYSLL